MLHHHVVFTTKYRRPVMQDAVGLRLRDLIREICKAHDVEILKGHVRPEHVHLLVSLPPNLAPRRLVQAIKGKTSHHLLREYRTLNKAFWGRHLWARGYFIASSGNVTDEVLKKYIATQDVEPQNDDNFKVSG